MTRTDPYQPVDAQTKKHVHEMIRDATHAALAVSRPADGHPSVSRIALATDDSGRPVTLISTLSDHTRALQENPACALLIGEPGDRGDPLTHPRLTLHCSARFIARSDTEHTSLRDRYLKLRPRSKLYIDFADFGFVRFEIHDGLLNAGFGKASRLQAADFTSRA